MWEGEGLSGELTDTSQRAVSVRQGGRETRGRVCAVHKAHVTALSPGIDFTLLWINA